MSEELEEEFVFDTTNAAEVLAVTIVDIETANDDMTGILERSADGDAPVGATIEAALKEAALLMRKAMDLLGKVLDDELASTGYGVTRDEILRRWRD